MGSAEVFTINNVAVVMLTTLVGLLLFKEKLNLKKLDRYLHCNNFYTFDYSIIITLSELKDTYKTIDKPFKGELFKDRGSKFYGYAYPITSEDEVKPIIEKLKKEHHTARHWCYAWQLGTTKIRYSANDDGEPSNSAGPPIYGQIQAFDVTNILVVVVRYFGGTKLGVGGLMNANKTGSKLVLEARNY